MNYKRIQKFVQGNYEAHQKDKYVVYKWHYCGVNYNEKRYYVITDGAVAYFVPESEFILDLEILPKCNVDFTKFFKNIDKSSVPCRFKEHLYDPDGNRDVDLYESENGNTYVNCEYVDAFKGKDIIKNVFTDGHYNFMFLYEYIGNEVIPIGIICPIMLPWKLKKKTA